MDIIRAKAIKVFQLYGRSQAFLPKCLLDISRGDHIPGKSVHRDEVAITRAAHFARPDRSGVRRWRPIEQYDHVY